MNGLTAARVIKKKGSVKKVRTKVINGCWWSGEFCPYNARHCGLREVNLGWCQSCSEVDLEHFSALAEVIVSRKLATLLPELEEILAEEIERLVNAG